MLSLISNLQLTKKWHFFLFQEGCAFTFHSLASCCSSLRMRLKGESYAEIWWPWGIIITKQSCLCFPSFCFPFFLSFPYFQLSSTHAVRGCTFSGWLTKKNELKDPAGTTRTCFLWYLNSEFELMSNFFNIFVKKKKNNGKTSKEARDGLNDRG